MAYDPKNKPGKMGKVTGPLQFQNIEIDGKTYQLLEARLERVRQDNPQVGDEVEYKISASKDLSEKGKISFFAIKKRAGGVQQPVQQTTPSEPAPAKAELVTQDIQAEYVTQEQGRVILKDCVGEQQEFRADLDVIKMIAKVDSQVQPGKKYKIRMVKQDGEWIISRMGTFDESFGEKPFRTGKEILQENLDQKRSETAHADAALAQINKENEQAAAREKENQEYLKTLTEGQKPMSTPEPTKEPENSPQNDDMTVPAASEKTNPLTDPLKDCPVEVKIHLDCGSYSNFDLTIPGLPTDQALAKIEEDGMKFVALLHRLMAESKKGY